MKYEYNPIIKQEPKLTEAQYQKLVVDKFNELIQNHSFLIATPSSLEIRGSVANGDYTLVFAAIQIAAAELGYFRFSSAEAVEYHRTCLSWARVLQAIEKLTPNSKLILVN